MSLTPKLAQLVDDAHDAGYTITPHAPNVIAIEKVRQYKSKRHVYQGVRVHLTETGGFYYALRSDVRLDFVTAIRSIKTVREILGLKP